jgi:N-hydroxyarylamine O-acetyltransferase
MPFPSTNSERKVSTWIKLPAMLEAGTRVELLRRIGLAGMPTADAAGLRAVHRAFVSRVPYEDLAVQLSECEPLERQALVRRILHGGRGGYCFEANTVLQTLLEALGFAVELRQGIVGARDAHTRMEPTNHMALVVHTPDEGPFIAEAGLGEGPLDPLPLAEGPVTAGEFELRIERVQRGWWVTQHPFGSFDGFWFSDAPATLADFEPHHVRLSTSLDSSFVRTLVVQRPFDDRIVTLRARTLSIDGPHGRERWVLNNPRAFAAALRDRFGIDPDALGPERLGRLWAKAEEQHEAHQDQRVQPPTHL